MGKWANQQIDKCANVQMCEEPQEAQTLVPECSKGACDFADLSICRFADL
jgi:hypothetical protein